MIDLVLCLALLLGPIVAVVVMALRFTPYRHAGPLPGPEAAIRAQRLLESTIAGEQLQEFYAQGYLAVASRNYPRREYHIWRNGGPVEVYDNGKYSMTLCVEPVQPLPPADLVLMHKLMIEGHEQEYLRVANKLARAGWTGGRRQFVFY